MIPKAQLLALAKHYELQPTTVQKDYVVGWLLRAISEHAVLSQWVFKGGTCLKKCYFETYRFSEDLDFTIPLEQSVSVDYIKTPIDEAVSWIESNSGLSFPRQYWKVEEYEKLRGKTSFQMKLPFSGPLGLPSKSLQRVKFDLTQDELIEDTPQLRNLHHDYTDVSNPPPQILCYSINEVLAEKTRALVERNGRARDVYDVVNISRNFRVEINPQRTKDIANKKFQFKGLKTPSVEYIMDSIDNSVLRANWEHQLAHQINKLPPVDIFIDDLRDAIAWWLKPEIAKPSLQPMPQASGEIVPRSLFPKINWQTGPTAMYQVRYAARNKLCALISYHRSTRLVEPYSMRYPSTGNEILHVWELEKNGMPSDMHKSFKTHEIDSASISNHTFIPKWEVEL
ncbi:MAG TPA: nucleotidyl transferase AbiEii/AbiGii toxin family protein [Methylophaga sp.]|nr:nucleotidyl transferase AbiEii/AbiGii toxin family protein [Methylophaga sp.]